MTPNEEARLELASLLYALATNPDESAQLKVCDRYASLPARDVRWAERYVRSCLVAQGLA